MTWTTGPGSKSMSEVHSTVHTAHPALWRRMFAFAGPAYLVSIGYMDPGNWATDLEGGAKFGYQLLWVLVLSNILAILLQTLSARLGIVTGRDLAQSCRDTYPRPVTMALWGLCEIAIAACDLAELLGAAIGLSLLFHIPLLAGVVLTAGDALLVLWFTRFGIRAIESLMLAFVSIIGGCFLLEIILAKPEWHAVALGLIPRINSESLYIAVGILGATVMPHNLYLHSSLVQTRRIGATERARRDACRFNLVDSVIALNGALLINAAILVLAGTVFHQRGIEVDQIQRAHEMLAPLLGTALAGVAFAVALICSGQSSTITGTMAGQIVMEGFVNIRMRPWLRRLLTRLVAVIPATITVYIAGEEGAYELLILSQVILSLQLPFAVVPLIQFTSDKTRMGNLANPGWVRMLAWLAAALIVSLNVWLAVSVIGQWPIWVVIPLAGGLLALLAYVALHPWLKARAPEPSRLPPAVSPAEVPVYRNILVPLDHSNLDRVALAHAVALGRTGNSHLYLLHVEEGVTSQLYGELAETAEVEEGQRYFRDLLAWVHGQGLGADLEIVPRGDPKEVIVQAAARVSADLLVMGAHGHKTLKDIVFGATINEVRHKVGVPVLIVRK